MSVGYRDNQPPLPTYGGVNDDQLAKRIIDAEAVYADLKLKSGCKYIRALSTKKDPRTHKNWPVFAGIIDLCDRLKITVNEYLRCVMWRTVDDLDRGFEVFPSMLLSEWAFTRWQMFRYQLQPEETQEKFNVDLLGTLKVSRNFLRARARGIFGDPDVPTIHLLRYQRSGTIHPEAIRWVFSGALSGPYLALSASFWAWVQEIPNDIRQEFIPVDDLLAKRQQLLADQALVAQAREIMGGDLYQP